MPINSIGRRLHPPTEQSTLGSSAFLIQSTYEESLQLVGQKRGKALRVLPCSTLSYPISSHFTNLAHSLEI